MNLLCVAIGGALGSVARYLTMQWVGQGAFPYGTLAVNVAGSLLMGLLAGWLSKFIPADAEEWRLLLGVGFLGGFTTFSAFSLDMWALMERSAWLEAGAYAFASVLLSVGALCMGIYIIRAL